MERSLRFVIFLLFSGTGYHPGLIKRALRDAEATASRAGG
jgi:hypothetical protein